MNELEIGADPPVVALTTTVLVPIGVPGFELPLPLLPLQEPSHRVENPKTTIRPSRRTPRSERFREPRVNMIPNSPGSSAA